MGMGGSSLAPLVFQRSFEPARHALPLAVLDTTDPATILGIERQAPIKDTLFIVASKSGTTAEPLAFMDYFYVKVKAIKGDRAGDNFVAITDPDSPLVEQAQARGFRHIFLNFADIGGQYSALSYFGLVPAALLGVDVDELLARALRMQHACDACVTIRDNPGLMLGAALGEVAVHGCHKVTYLVSKPVETLGLWLEQLLAESTGKEGAGLLPVADEPIGDPTVYGDDRLFVYLRLRNMPDEPLEQSIARLERAGQPVITIDLEDALDLGQEFFRWEIATAAAGAILGINAFDQPNVQESKDNTRRRLKTVEDKGTLPEERPTLVESPLSWYAAKSETSLADALHEFLAQAQADDYVALMAYFTEEADTHSVLQTVRSLLRDRLHVATTLGYGPRFLHSTGQFHKGGPNTGLFVQLTADDIQDAPIPGRPYTFGTFKRAQALGDLEALRKHDRRVVRIHLGPDVRRGLSALLEALQTAEVVPA